MVVVVAAPCVRERDEMKEKQHAAAAQSGACIRTNSSGDLSEARPTDLLPTVLDVSQFY
jgi:hypothetical protein